MAASSLPSETISAAASRVMDRCEKIAACSEDPLQTTRLFLSPPMHDVHRQMGEWMGAAGLQVAVDAIGNVIGHRPGPVASKRLLLGSHLDTVPNAGKYDGVLGVLVALAALEQLAADTLPFAVDLIGFSEEEGVRFCAPFLGSKGVAGCFDPELLQRVDGEQVSMRDAIVSFGLDPELIPNAAYDADEVIGYVEAHLEQGPLLEREGHALGIVSGIAGQSRLRVEFVGEAGHAGTTPMEGRRDAALGAAALIQRTNELGRQTDGLRATVGYMRLEPNVPNVIPRLAELILDVRHPNDSLREQAIEQLLAFAQQTASAAGLKFRIVDELTQAATKVDARLTRLLSQAARREATEPLHLVSGAGHDAVVMATRFPVAMLFIRHPGGVSHSPEERVNEEDVAAAIETLVRFLQQLGQEIETS